MGSSFLAMMFFFRLTMTMALRCCISGLVSLQVRGFGVRGVSQPSGQMAFVVISLLVWPYPVKDNSNDVELLNAKIREMIAFRNQLIAGVAKCKDCCTPSQPEENCPILVSDTI